MEEGYFDYSYKSSLGKPKLPLSSYNSLIHTAVGAVKALLYVDLFFYYRIEGGSTEVILKEVVEDEEPGTLSIICRFKRKSEFEKAELLDFMRQWILQRMDYYGTHYMFKSSPIVSQEEFVQFNEALISEVRNIRKSGYEKYKEEPIIKYCIENELELLGSTKDTNIFETFCPNGSHHIIMNAESGSWFCGYCRKNGVFADFVEFVEKSNKSSRDSL